MCVMVAQRTPLMIAQQSSNCRLTKPHILLKRLAQRVRGYALTCQVPRSLPWDLYHQ